MNKVKRVNRKKILLLRFDNFQEGANLIFDRLCFLLRGYFNSDPYVRVSASIAFPKIPLKWTVIYLIRSHEEWSFSWLTKKS